MLLAREPCALALSSTSRTEFHQVLLSADVSRKTAFVTPDDQYQYWTMPYGLTCACHFSMADQENFGIVYLLNMCSGTLMTF